jgi:C-terminal processing protease CtpA/Prc
VASAACFGVTPDSVLGELEGLRALARSLVYGDIIPGGGAEAAGIAVGDRVIAIDGMPVEPLGVEGAVAKIRGAAGTTITVTLRRGDQPVQLIVERRKIHT